MTGNTRHSDIQATHDVELGKEFLFPDSFEKIIIKIKSDFMIVKPSIKLNWEIAAKSLKIFTSLWKENLFRPRFYLQN